MLEELKKIGITDILKAASNAMAIINFDGKILQSNDEFQKLLPLSKGNANIADAIVDTSKSEEVESLNKSLEKKTTEISIYLQESYKIKIKLSFKLIDSESLNLYLCSANKEYKYNEGDYLQQLINTIPDSIFIKDRDCKFILANDWLAKVIGANHAKEVVGKSDFDYHPEKLAQQYYSDEQEVIRTEQAIVNKREKVIINSKNAWYSTTKIPFYDDAGQVKGIMGIGRDITSDVKKTKALKKAKTKAEIADQLKTAFLANLSHEIRTPLNGIIGFSQFLLSKEIDKQKQEKYLNIIQNNGQQLLMLINDIIDVSMIGSNQILLKYNTFRIGSVIEQIKESFEQHIHDRELPIVISCSMDLKNGEDKIYSDDFRINQILNNLLINALKFTPEGEINLGYRLKPGFLEFFVEDTGIGIEEEQQKEIFNRFRQADESITRTYGGTGLGLSICKGLVELLGGKIWVESKLNEGTIFKFTIPYAKNAPEV